MGLKPVNNLANNVNMQVAVDFVNGGNSAFIQCGVYLRQQVEHTFGST